MFKRPPKERTAIHRLSHVIQSWENPSRPKKRIKRPQNRLGLLAQGHMPGFPSLGQGQREDAVFQVNLIPSQTKLLSPPQSRFNRKGDQLPVTLLHDPSQPPQLITSQPPGPLHFGEELQTRYRVLSQLAVFDRQHEHMT